MSVYELSTIIIEFGLPFVIRCNNGQCYIFKEFLQWFGIDHKTSSPMHPRSSGFAEHMMGVAKKLMEKAGKEGKSWISGLLEHRVTPISQYNQLTI